MLAQFLNSFVNRGCFPQTALATWDLSVLGCDVTRRNRFIELQIALKTFISSPNIVDCAWLIGASKVNLKIKSKILNIATIFWTHHFLHAKFGISQPLHGAAVFARLRQGQSKRRLPSHSVLRPQTLQRDAWCRYGAERRETQISFSPSTV